MSAEQRLRDLGHGAAAGADARRQLRELRATGNLVFCSGTVPTRKPMATISKGKRSGPNDLLTEESAVEHARSVALNLLAIVRQEARRPRSRGAS